MDWNDLKYVLAVSRSQSFKNAARVLKVSHTTVGRRIQALEDALGTVLFERKPNGVVPTEQCQSLLTSAARIETEFQSLQHDVQSPTADVGGEVRINTAPWIIESVLCPAIPNLRTTFPDVRLMLIGDVVESHYDFDGMFFSLRFDIQARRHEIEMPICEIPFSVFAPKHAPKTLPWVTNGYNRVMLNTRAWLSHTHPDAEAVVAASDASMVRAAISAGVGQGLIPDFLGLNDPNLECRSSDGPELLRRYRALVPRHIAQEPAVRAVLSWASKALCEVFDPIGDAFT